MASTLSNASISSQISVDIVRGGLLGTVTHRNAQTPAIGTVTNQVNLVFQNDFTVATGTPITFDLTSLTDPAGAAINFGHVTHFHVENFSTITGEDLTIGGGTNGLFAADPKPVRANGGNVQHADPNPGILVDGTHKIIQLAAAAGTAVLGRITIIGRTT